VQFLFSKFIPAKHKRSLLRKEEEEEEEEEERFSRQS